MQTINHRTVLSDPTSANTRAERQWHHRPLPQTDPRLIQCSEHLLLVDEVVAKEPPEELHEEVVGKVVHYGVCSRVEVEGQLARHVDVVVNVHVEVGDEGQDDGWQPGESEEDAQGDDPEQDQVTVHAPEALLRGTQVSGKRGCQFCLGEDVVVRGGW